MVKVYPRQGEQLVDHFKRRGGGCAGGQGGHRLRDRGRRREGAQVPQPGERSGARQPCAVVGPARIPPSRMERHRVDGNGWGQSGHKETNLTQNSKKVA